MEAGTHALVWFRRDLRATDHAALHHALRHHERVWCVFCFDTEILACLPSRRHRRVEFLHHAADALHRDLERAGGGLIVLHARARDAIPALARELGVRCVYINHDYEPAAIARDTAVRESLRAAGIGLHTSKDQVIFERGEIVTQAGKPFTVYTPYKNAWLARLSDDFVAQFPIEPYAQRLAPPPAAHRARPSLADLGFEQTNLLALGFEPSPAGAERAFADFLERIDAYDQTRDFPAAQGTSYLSVHLRFGTISVRRLAREARTRSSAGAQVWLSELVWRDFYFQILAQFPHVIDGPFRPEYAKVKFDDDPRHLDAWKNARTGYPIVDAAMNQLNRTGFMHNRLRMVAASFLIKHLLVHWRHGERYFEEQLNDWDLAANNGNWQWVASSGNDAQPYFRIFNPIMQSERFDPDGQFIRRYVPGLARVPAELIHTPWKMSAQEQALAGCVIGRDYPPPIVEHAAARRRALERYEVVKAPS